MPSNSRNWVTHDMCSEWTYGNDLATACTKNSTLSGISIKLSVSPLSFHPFLRQRRNEGESCGAAVFPIAARLWKRMALAAALSRPLSSAVPPASSLSSCVRSFLAKNKRDLGRAWLQRKGEGPTTLENRHQEERGGQIIWWNNFRAVRSHTLSLFFANIEREGGGAYKRKSNSDVCAAQLKRNSF